MPLKIRIGIDQGGTFTDCIAACSNSVETATFSCKVLTNSNCQNYSAPHIGVRQLIQKIQSNYPNHSIDVESVRLGTTITTNAVLQNKGKSVGVLITSGFEDLFWIGDQSRKDIFDLRGQNPRPAYSKILGVEERVVLKQNNIYVETKPQKAQIRPLLDYFKNNDIESIAICLIHSWKFTEHEQLVAEWCRKAGFLNVFCSHEVSYQPNFLKRSYLTVIDAGLSPLISNIQNDFIKNLNDLKVRKHWFMKSDAGLCSIGNFRGCNSLLSGPCGGVTALSKFFTDNLPLIGFDMGGTSSDVTRFDGEVDISLDHTIDGLPMHIPQVNIETVANGGGSILSIEDGLLKVGPESSGSYPGPLCYGFDGRLSLSDANIVLGRLQPTLIKACFGVNRDEPLNVLLARKGFENLLRMNPEVVFRSIEELAEAFVMVANQQMSQPILEVSLAKGYELNKHSLVCFGAAAGQHACQIAKDLGLKKVLIHHQAGLLSAAGLLAACPEDYKYYYIGKCIDSVTLPKSLPACQSLSAICRYSNTNTFLKIDWHPIKSLKYRFEQAFYKQFGFTHKNVKILVEHAVTHHAEKEKSPELASPNQMPSKHEQKVSMVNIYVGGKYQSIPCYPWQDYPQVAGPAIIYNQFTSIFVEHGFKCYWDSSEILTLKLEKSNQSKSILNEALQVSLFAGRIQSIARQMGQVLQKTALSINIRERLDFSCAIFSPTGELICNAPHIPVHLGSMSSTVKSLLQKSDYTDFLEACLSNSQQGILCNSPNTGGTHLPDLTLISPIVFENKLLGWLASRGHHSDVGGMSPGSMSAQAQYLSDEGLCLEFLWIVKKGRFLTKEFQEQLEKSGARNSNQNIADVKAQWNANLKGQTLLKEYLHEYGYYNWLQNKETLLQTSHKISQNLLDKLLDKFLQSREFLDDGSRLELQIFRESEFIVFDFGACSNEVKGPFNAPKAISYSALIYCLRCMINRNIPLNDGLMRSVKLRFRKGSILSPSQEAAVCAGNVTTSQRLVDLIFKAFEWCGASQGCMNNVIFGNEFCTFYETIAGGHGAMSDWHGAHGKHSHMTNTKITDVEIIERELPLILRRFSLRKNSGGDGQFRGGDGVFRHLEFMENFSLSLLTERRLSEPYGMHGGQPGKSGQNILLRNGLVRLLGSREELKILKGDQLIIKTPGGGGYGAP